MAIITNRVSPPETAKDEPLTHGPTTNTESSILASTPKAGSSILGPVFRIFGVIALVGAIGAIVLGALAEHYELFATGAAGILTAILLFGFAEFFIQVARIAVATEETARILRERPSGR